ncbi:unnamed protein product [Heligmosomoides polygyrus]|uniref:Attacin_C domain-containing protein n=1 Tax=Heligmosomoides polygyrus TaxID=6339 RepID=A0A183FGM3_HELPZ|nr:unnamed protein product [Heligmosomoides polygyrus]
MPRAAVLSSCFFVVSVLFINGVWAQLVPNHVSINEKHKHIEADSSWLDKRQQEIQRETHQIPVSDIIKHVVVRSTATQDAMIQVALDASNKEKVILDLLNTQQRFSASASGNVAAADTFDGKRAQVQKIGDKGGIATVDGHKAQLRTKEDETGRHAFLKADGQYDLDTVASGDLKDPAEKGKSGNYAYTITQTGKKTDATISAHDIGAEGFAESLFGRRSEKYHCTGL